MNFKVFFGFLCIALLSQQSEASAFKKGVVAALRHVNQEAGQLANKANDYFVHKLQNETQIKEWSVNIQAKVLNFVTDNMINAFEFMKQTALELNPPPGEQKLLECIAQEETAFHDAVDSFARNRGWCNNRLAANLTTGFQEVTQQFVAQNKKFASYINTLEKCFFGDMSCLTAYVTEVASYVVKEIAPGGALTKGLQDVVAIYKIMFGQDVPDCDVKWLPVLNSDLSNIVNKINKCAA